MFYSEKLERRRACGETRLTALCQMRLGSGLAHIAWIRETNAYTVLTIHTEFLKL